MFKSICYSCVPGANMDEKFANVKQCGFAGIEVPTTKDDQERAEYKAASAKHGLTIHSIMAVGNWATPISSDQPEIVEKSLTMLRRSIDDAVFFGATTVLLVPGVVNEDNPYEKVMVNAKKNIAKIVSYAEEKKIYVCLENVWNKFLLSPIEFKEFVTSFQSEYIQAYFDVGNIVLYGYPQHWIKNLGSLIKKIHIKGFDSATRNFVHLLKGTIDWEAVMKALREIGYDSYITAELGVDERGLQGISDDISEIFAK